MVICLSLSFFSILMMVWWYYDLSVNENFQVISQCTFKTNNSQLWMPGILTVSTCSSMTIFWPQILVVSTCGCASIFLLAPFSLLMMVCLSYDGAPICRLGSGVMILWLSIEYKFWSHLAVHTQDRQCSSLESIEYWLFQLILVCLSFCWHCFKYLYWCTNFVIIYLSIDSVLNTSGGVMVL